MTANAELAGKVAFLNFGDILQLLGSNGSTGVLRLSSRQAPEPGFVYIEKGNPIHCRIGKRAGLAAFNDLFGWLEASFDFHENPLTCPKTIQKSRMNLILDGLSLLDEGQITKLGAVPSRDSKAAAGGVDDAAPVIKGPRIDYFYVADEESHEDGETIIAEGQHGNWFYVILDGVVRISKKTERGTVEILRIGKGAFLGSMASFGFGGNVRGANAVAEGRVVLGVLDAPKLGVDFARLSSTFQQILFSLDKRLRETTRTAARLLEGRPADEDLIRDREPVINQGEHQDVALKSIVVGEAVVIHHTPRGEFTLARLSAGDFCGHIPFLAVGHEPQAASVWGSKDLKLKPLDADALQQEHARASKPLRALMEHFANCISVTTWLAGNVYKQQASK